MLFYYSKAKDIMTGIENFNKYFREYDLWFEKNKNLYLSELKAIRYLMPDHIRGIEIGSGTGRFSIPFGINFGVEPSKKMLETAVKSGMKSVMGVAEALPFRDEICNLVLMVTTVCFLKDPKRSFEEVFRILNHGGSFIIGFVDRESSLGRSYLKKKEKSKFYKSAEFYSVSDINSFLKYSGFKITKTIQTLFSADNSRVEDFREGFGEGAFIAIRAIKKRI